eukprot:SAG25_NODE_7060_length_508_cov_1.603912_1_plen_100_part_10
MVPAVPQAINDVYRINLSVLQDALVAERKSAKSWGSGGVDRERRRRGRGGGDRPKQKRQKTTAEMQVPPAPHLVSALSVVAVVVVVFLLSACCWGPRAAD